jgi:heterodisulfide reductase subunit C
MTDVLRFSSSDAPSRNPLRALVEERTGQDALSCYQCGKCSAGCPVVRHMDLGPQRVLRAIQMGQKDQLLHSSTIWLCVACQTCNERCPREIDIPRIMDSLRALARQENVRPSPRTVGIFHDVFLKDVEWTGRLYEAGLFGGYVAASFQFMDGLDIAFRLGLPMFMKGKIGVVPERIKQRGELAEIYKRTAAMK